MGPGAARVIEVGWKLPVEDIYRTTPSPATRVAFSPDSTLLAMSSSEGVWLARPGDPAPTHLMPNRFGSPPALAFSPSGKSLLAVAISNSVHLWDMTTRQEIGRIQSEPGTISSLAFTPDGRSLVTGSFEIGVWDVATQRPAASPISIRSNGETRYVSTLAVSPDGTLLAAGSGDRTVRLWRLPGGDPVGRPLAGHTDRVAEVGFTVDSGHLYSVGRDGTVRFWEARSGGHNWWVSGEAAQRTAAAGRSAGIVASGDEAGHITLWDSDVHRVAADICRLGGDPLTADEWRNLRPGLTYQRACP